MDGGKRDERTHTPAWKMFNSVLKKKERERTAMTKEIVYERVKDDDSDDKR